MLSCYDVAKYFIYLTYTNRHKRIDGDYSITHLKLQKLLYYAQSFYLALYDKPLFPERIRAWKLGPVIAELWHEYKKYGWENIPSNGEVNLSIDAGTTTVFLEAIYDSIGHFSAFQLSTMTHQEGPWKSTQSNCEIMQQAMKLYYKNKIDDFGLRKLALVDQHRDDNTPQPGRKRRSAFDIYLKSKEKWSGVYRRLANS